MINLEKGSITGTSYGSVIMNTGTFNMNGGTITKQIDQSGGILNINGGTLKGYLTVSNASTVNLNGGTVAASDSSFGAILMNSGTLTLSDKVIFKDNKIDINLRSVSGMSTHYSVMNISEKLTGNPIKICVRKDNSPPSISELPLVLTKGLPGHGTKDNFTFVGDGFELDENDDGELILIPASNATITYHKNDGTDEIITQRAFSDTSQDNPYMTTLKKNTFSRDYYQYVNWNTNSDGSGFSYEDGAKFQLAGSMDLYAMWNLEKFAISYDLGEGSLPSGEKNPETYTFEDKITLVNPNPVSDDYDFMGWTGTGLNQETKDVTIPAGSHGDRSYIANYKMKSYTVSFDTNGGSKIASQNVKIHHKPVKPSDPTWKGYRFVGWYANQELTIPYNFDQEITADAQVYAMWEVLPAPLPVEVIMAKGTPYGTRAIKISWTKVKSASKYKVYAGKCNHLHSGY